MDLDVCGIFSMEFESLRLDMRRLQSEADDLGKRIECVYSTTPYDVVKEFASKLHKLCDTLKYMTERLREMHRYGSEAWRLPKRDSTMQELLTRREEALEYYRLQCEGFECEHTEDAEDEIDANFSNVDL